MLPENIIYIGLLISFITILLYIKDIFHGETRPNLISWFMWMLAPFIGIFFQIKAGAGLSILPVFMAGFGPLLVIIFSLFKKNAYWKIEKLDVICGIISLTALVVYALTYNLGISILFAIISDGLAGVPTIIKSWKFPETESGLIYLGSIVSNTLGLLIITNWNFTVCSFGFYLILVNLIISFCIYRNRIFKKAIFS